MYLFFCAVFLRVFMAGCELKGRYTRGVNDYNIVVPQKVSENGEFISYYLPHFYNEARVRRGADAGKVHYTVPIEGLNKLLELLPSKDFHGPGLVIEHHDHDARMNFGNIGIRKPRKLNCYYQGWVKNEPSSSAAISTCSGLAGAITIGSNNFLIEPVEEDETPTTGPQHKHIVYKREHEKHNRSICGTKETFATAFKERMEWEEKYGKETEKTVMGNDYLKPQFAVKQNIRSKKWCTTCRPKMYNKCQSPYPPCQMERPLFLELAIVVGPRVAADIYIFKDTEQFINTIINIAARHFQDSTLERPILIKLVRVITLGFLYEDLDPFRYKPEELLKRFCEWQMHFNPSREVHPNHHDFVLYLTKLGDCSGEMQGLTNMASICRPDKACGVVSLEGLLTAHVITHMLGHSMGADHDDENVSGCLPEEPDGTCYHMGEHICTRSTAWSICSRHCISKFTSTHAAWCMSDVPTSHDLTAPSLLPGQVYSAAEQCKLNFEIDTYACLVGEFCKHLFCKINDNECVSTGEPPAQGTRCGPDQWCFNQRCVHRGSRPGATNGEWGIWSQWTPCTKSCGGGVQTANRACDSPAPTNGGRLCPGPWIKSRMCNIGSCPDAGKGFLDQQCKSTNAKPYRGRKHEWLYFNQQVEDLKCVVMCVNERSEVAVRAPLAIDGTFCKPGSKDVCIRGTCEPVGCDWVIGSNAKEDACGVCHGNGTECKVIQGYFTEQNFQGKMSFLKLPVGTSMILMRETRPSPCFFVIANSLNSTYYLNNDEAEERIFYAGSFMIQHTFGIYQLKSNMERIFIKDRLKVPITVSVVCRQLEPTVGILYQYALPEPNSPDVKPHYTWEFLSWERCPQACGGAVQRAKPVCVEAQGGEVEDSYCPADSRPIDRIRVCNPKPCKAKWWVGPWSECDCYMNGGIKTRMVMCAHLKAARSSYITIVTEEECLGEDKPFSEKPCDKDAESIFWLKKGERKKRDYMDLVPYTREIENYSVWNDSLEGSPRTVNVRDLFGNLDQENVEDYIFMRKIGMAPGFWNNVRTQPGTFNGRVRWRKAVTTSNKNAERTTEKVPLKISTDALKNIKESQGPKRNQGGTNVKHDTKNEPRDKDGNQNKDKSELPKIKSSKPSQHDNNLRTDQTNEKVPLKITIDAIKNIKESQGQKPNQGKTNVKYDTQKEPRDKDGNQNKDKSELPKIKSSKPTQHHNNLRTESLRWTNNVRYSTSKATEKYKTDSVKGKGMSTDEPREFYQKTSKPAAAKFEIKQELPKEPMQHRAKGQSKNPRNNESKPTKNIQKMKILNINNSLSDFSIVKKLKVSKTANLTSKGNPNEEGSARTNERHDSSTRRVKHTTSKQSKVQITARAKNTGKLKADHENEIMVDDPLMTEAISTIPATVENQQKLSKNMPEDVSKDVISTRDDRKYSTAPTTLTIPEVKIAPGLTPYQMYATETPTESGKCWRKEVITTIVHPSCIPNTGEAQEPADNPPEVDYLNTSNVKIFVVPIQTTLRTIIQNDNEFVLMETLAKYPVADEMKIQEHSGDAARKKLKIASRQKPTTKIQVQD